MSSLSNYLRTNRKRAALSQEEAAFLLGIYGPNKAAKVCRDENFVREPTLQTALAYEVIYGRPVRELFAGQYQRIEQDVAARAKILAHRKDRRPNQKKHQTLAQLFLRHVKPAI
jgi:transcriptional regulator with XRE-family HTH domain